MTADLVASWPMDADVGRYIQRYGAALVPTVTSKIWL